MNIYQNSNLKKTVKKNLLISPQGKITVTSEGSRERKLAVPPLGLGYLAASWSAITKFENRLMISYNKILRSWKNYWRIFYG